MRPRIAFFTTVYDHAKTGSGTFVQYLRRAVREGRLDVVFFSDDISAEKESFERAVQVPAWARRLPGAFLVRGASFHRAFLEEHARQPFDLAWHINVLTSWRSLLSPLPVPVVGMINDASNLSSRTPWSTARDLGSYRAFVRFIWRFVERATARNVECVVANSGYLHRAITDGYDIAPDRLALMYKAVALDKFQYAERPINGASLRVLFIKSDYVRGGLEDLFAALPLTKADADITIIGPDGLEINRIELLADRYGIREKVRFLGTLSREAIVEQFASHDVLCLPSRSEALGVVFLEALASGLPAIGSEVGGIPEVLDGGRAGWLVKPHDPEGIARALCAVQTRSEERLSKVRYGREHVRQFTYERMIQRMHEVAVSTARCG